MLAMGLVVVRAVGLLVGFAVGFVVGVVVRLAVAWARPSLGCPYALPLETVRRWLGSGAVSETSVDRLPVSPAPRLPTSFSFCFCSDGPRAPVRPPRFALHVRRLSVPYLCCLPCCPNAPTHTTTAAAAAAAAASVPGELQPRAVLPGPPARDRSVLGAAGGDLWRLSGEY